MTSNNPKQAYKIHLEKWEHARELVAKHNQDLIREWDSIPWYKFWVKKPSLEEKRQIIMDNWNRFNRLPKPILMDYFPINL